MNKQKIEYHQLNTGFEFPPASYQADSSMVADYIRVVGENSTLYQDSELVPPMAVAALTIAELSKAISLPAGAIHVSQELEFKDTVSTGDTLTSNAKVSRNLKRGNFQILTIDLSVSNQHDKAVLTGKTDFILPEPDAGGES